MASLEPFGLLGAREKSILSLRQKIGLGAPIVAALVGTAFMLVVQPDRGGSVSAESSEPSPFDDVMARAKAMTRSRAGDTG
ncbi:hypothetical protein [Glycomyces xiaoerkulensis]|uniref:hypothetical protein n=1 Tax=Glycomyces xiaoerkulensis TaxID=2038139 RepID=UPI0012FFE5F8|nr:hypothetical protein [Glycomyces xiaoerkulensis]